MAASLHHPVIWANQGVWCWEGLGGGQGGVMLTRNIKGRGGRWGEERGDTKIRLMKENERKYRSGAGLHGKHDKKTTGLS